MSETEQQDLHVELITPRATMLACDDGRRVFLPTPLGEYGILPGHSSLISVLATGQVRIEQPEKTDAFAVSGGLLEVYPDRVLIIAETAERAEEIDVDRATASNERAEQRVADAGRDESIDLKRAEAALARALNRIKVASAFHDATVDNED